MKGRLAIIALICVGAFVVAGSPNNYSTPNESKPQQEVKAPPTSKGAHEPDTNTGKAHGDPPQWYTAIKWSEWLLVVAAFATLAVIAWQSWETRKSSEAMRDSFRLQEAALQQWVEIDNWSVSERPAESVLAFRFDLVNGTKLPLTIIKVIASIETQESVTFQSNVLAPGGRHTAEASVVLDGDRFHGYSSRKTMLLFEIKGVVVFIDVLKKRQAQRFEGWISCTRGKVTFEGVQPARDYENT
jgi:hypothetical protein